MALTSSQIATSKSRCERLIRICSSLPQVKIEPIGDHLAIRLGKKTLAYYQFDHHADGMISLACKSSVNQRTRLIREDPETFFVPAYLGAKGWIGIRLDLDDVDWEVVTELMKAAIKVWRRVSWRQ